MTPQKHSFGRTQFRYLFRTLPERRSLWHISHFPQEVLALSRNLWRLRQALCQPTPTFRYSGKQCVVVLLSHNRPHNLGVIVRSALKNNFVRRLVVSNSNRSVRIKDWITAEDPRLMLVDETLPTQPGHRFVLAEREAGDYFLSVDDDIILTPLQWALFFERLLEDENVPHGLTGNVFRPGSISSNGSPFHQVAGVDAPVDVLIGAYAFTRAHLRRTFELARALDMPDLSAVRNGEDILLSCSGIGQSRIHDVGRLFCCASSAMEGVALWKTHGNFWDERVRLFKNAVAARAALPV